MEEFSGKYQAEFDRLSKELKDIEDKCLKDGDSWDSFVEKTRDIRAFQFELEKDIRNSRPVGYEGERDWDGKIIKMDEFIKKSKSGEFLDDSGTFYYSMDKNKTDAIILPSDVLYDKIRDGFKTVIMINDKEI